MSSRFRQEDAGRRLVLESQETSLNIEEKKRVTELAAKKELSVDEFTWLFQISKRDTDLVTALVEQKISLGVTKSPLYKLSGEIAVKKNQEIAKQRRTDGKGARSLKRHNDREQAIEYLLPEFSPTVRNIHHFLEALLSIADLKVRTELMGLLKHHLDQSFNIYHYLEIAATLQLNQRSGDDTDADLTDQDDIDQFSTRYLRDLTRILIDTSSVYLGTRFFSKWQVSKDEMKPYLIPVVMPFIQDNLRAASSTLETKDSAGGMRVVSNSGVGYLGWTKLAASSTATIIIDCCDIVLTKPPKKPDYLSDWNAQPLSRFGLPVCLESMTTRRTFLEPDRQWVDAVVFPRQNATPLLGFIGRRELQGFWTYEQVGETLFLVRMYQDRPSAEDQAYPSGVKLMEALLMLDQERYVADYSDQLLGYAKIGAIALPRRGGRVFEFSYRDPEEKKIFELGVRRISFLSLSETGEQNRELDVSANRLRKLVGVEVTLVGNVKITFKLLSNGNISDVSIDFGGPLSDRTKLWLRNFAVYYLGALEQAKAQMIRLPESDTSAVGSDSAQTRQEVRNSADGFRVIAGKLPDHDGQWVNPDAEINQTLSQKLGIELLSLNRLFISLQRRVPIILGESEVDKTKIITEALDVIEEFNDHVIDKSAIAVLLQILWFRARNQYLDREVNGNEKYARASKRLIQAINSGLLGERKTDGEDSPDKLFTVTFVEESNPDRENQLSPDVLHDPTLALGLFRLGASRVI